MVKRRIDDDFEETVISMCSNDLKLCDSFTLILNPFRSSNKDVEELVFNGVEQNIEVLGIQEHRIFHEEPVRYETVLGKTPITTSATKNSAGHQLEVLACCLTQKQNEHRHNILLRLNIDSKLLR